MTKFNLMITVPALLYGAVSAGQLQDAQWVFGNDLGLSFQTGIPVVTSTTCNPTAARQPAVVSDATGNLVCYTDGDKVYNSSHEVIMNGDLSSAQENLIVPYPGNPDKYYLLRSNSNGFFYCIIDMTMDGGNGGIATGDVDITISANYCQITGSVHPNGEQIWIITSDNENGFSDNIRFTSYLLSSEGLELTDSISNFYIFGGWYSVPDDLRISPDCSKLATTYKGHYLVLCKFDNTTGELFDMLPSYIDFQTGFGVSDLDKIEFSPNSNYFYALGDQYFVKQYSIETWNVDAIAVSAITVENEGFGSEIWTDIKLGRDGAIYLHDVAAGEIDVIYNPDDNGSDVEITDAVISGLDLDYFFPNTANFLCGMLMNISVEHIYECLGDSTAFTYNLTSPADSIFWDFADPATGDNNFSTEDEPIHVFSETGLFLVEFNYYANGSWNTLIHEVNIYALPEVNLPDLINACTGEEVVIDAGVSPYTYLWNTGATSQSIVVTSQGIYSVTITNGTCSAADSTSVLFTDPVSLNLDSDYVLCEGDSLVLDLSASGADAIDWSTGYDGTVLVITEAGSYAVSAVNACASVSESFDVEVVVFPASLLPASLTACASEPVELAVDDQGGVVAWSTGETGTSLWVDESGIYGVTVSVGACSFSDEISVTLFEFIPLDALEIPNIFTPDGDGNNEVFRPFMRTDPEFNLCNFSGIEVSCNIYDRWGNLHAESACVWEGRSKGGNLLEDGVYYYIIQIRSVCSDQDEKDERDGWVHLVAGK